MSSFRAYAKINLGLLVLEKRPDGYHSIETVFHRIDLFDEITISPSPEIIVESSSREAPGDERNICFKAADLLRRQLGVNEGVKISIQKNVPVGAGLGGGSSDAATVLRRLPSYWGKGIDEEQLGTLALKLGSDVPYFLGNGSAVAKGRGEVLEYFPLDLPYTILLCNPGIHISTAWAYQQIAPRAIDINLKQILADPLMTASLLRERLRNDFEVPVFAHHPEVKRIKEDMLRSGAEFALMSGSGSSVFGLFSHRNEAEQIARAFRSKGYKTFSTPPHFVPEEV